MKAADLLVASLESYGVSHIYALPGEENLDIIESIAQSSIELVTTRNEQTAVFMAATRGRLTGMPGVAIATLGPGATNMMTGIAYAQLGAMPLIAITGQKPIRTSKQSHFQVIDVVGMMSPITKYASSIVDGARVASTIAHARQTAIHERPGAVHIELPEDIAGHDVHPTYADIIPYQKIRRPQIDEKQLTQLISALEGAHCPMILVGAGANRKRVAKYLSKLVTKYHIPFFASQMGKGVLDEGMDEYIGTAALTSDDRLHPVIKQSDLIIAIGHDTIEKPTNIIQDGSTQVIHINFTPAHIDQLYVPTMQVIGDIGNTLRQLCESDIDSSGRDFDNIYALSTHQRQVKQDYEQTLIRDDIMTPVPLVRMIREALADEDIVSLDNGLYKVRFARNYETRAANTLLLDNALATMGAGYSAGMAAAQLYPDRRVVCVVGDGGLMINLGDLSTIATLDINLTIIVLRDDAYGMISWKQTEAGLVDYGMDLHNPNIVALAESFGLQGYRVHQPAELPQLLDKTRNGIHIIDVPFAYPKEIFVP